MFIPFYQVKNTGETEESLGGFSLKSTSLGNFLTLIKTRPCSFTALYSGLASAYKFHRSVKLEAGGVVTVWNSDAGVEHKPSEGQLVMKESGFKFGETVDTSLVDKDGEVVATRLTKMEKEAFGSSKRFAGRRSGGAPAKEGEKCVVM